MQLPSDNNTPVRTAASPPRARIVVVAVVVESVAAAVVVGCLTKNPRCSHRFSRVPRRTPFPRLSHSTRLSSLESRSFQPSFPRSSCRTFPR